MGVFTGHYKIVPVHIASILRVGDVYRFGWDGFREEFEPEEAYRLYCIIENALIRSNGDSDNSVAIKIKDQDCFLDIKREQLMDIYRFLRSEERTGRATWMYMFD